MLRLGSLTRVVFPGCFLPTFMSVVRRFVELTTDSVTGLVNFDGNLMRGLSDFACRGICFVMTFGC